MDVLSSAIVSPVHILSMVIMPTITQFVPNGAKLDVLSSAIVSPVHILSMVIMPTITQFAPNVAKLDVLSSAIVSPLRTLSMVIMPTIICLEVSGHPVFYLGEALGDNLISVALPWVRASQGTHTFTRVCGSDKPGGGGAPIHSFT